MKISIITVCYNSELTIEKTLKSIMKLKEIDNDIEYIVIDGASNDNTNNIIMEYSSIVDQYISEPDTGIYDALNKGIKLSTSEWIMLLAADDIIIPQGILSFKNLVNSSTDIWCGSNVCKDSIGYYIQRSSKNLDQLKDRCVLRNPASIFRKNIFDKFGYYDTRFKCNGDGELFYRMYINNVTFQIEDIPLVVFGMEGISSDPTKYAIPERALIYHIYGLMSDSQISKWEKKAIGKAKIKSFLKKFYLIKKYISIRKKYLSKDALEKIGVLDLA